VSKTCFLRFTLAQVNKILGRERCERVFETTERCKVAFIRAAASTRTLEYAGRAAVAESSHGQVPTCRGAIEETLWLSVIVNVAGLAWLIAA
jgi:hypothetical protein